MLFLKRHDQFNSFYQVARETPLPPKYLDRVACRMDTIRLFTEPLPDVNLDRAAEIEHRLLEINNLTVPVASTFAIYVIISKMGWRIELIKCALAEACKVIGHHYQALGDDEWKVVMSLLKVPEVKHDYARMVEILRGLERGALFWILNYVSGIIDTTEVPDFIMNPEEGKALLITSTDNALLFRDGKWEHFGIRYYAPPAEYIKSRPYKHVSLSLKTWYEFEGKNLNIRDEIPPEIIRMPEHNITKFMVTYDYMSNEDLEGKELEVVSTLGGHLTSNKATFHNGVAFFSAMSHDAPTKFYIKDPNKVLPSGMFVSEKNNIKKEKLPWV
jgi:hypothetical protein